MNLKIDLDKLKSPKEAVFGTIRLGNYTITTENNALIVKCGDKIIAEHKNNDWFLEGYSINSIWKTLENHYEAIMTIQK